MAIFDNDQKIVKPIKSRVFVFDDVLRVFLRF